MTGPAQNLAGGQVSPSFVFGGSQIAGTGGINTFPILGSMDGVPPINHVAGMDTAGDAAQSVASYGASAAASPPHQQASFWSLALLVLGVLILAHVAHISLRE